MEALAISGDDLLDQVSPPPVQPAPPRVKYIVEKKQSGTVGWVDAPFHPVTFSDDIPEGYTYGYRNPPTEFDSEEDANDKAARTFSQKDEGWRVVPA